MNTRQAKVGPATRSALPLSLPPRGLTREQAAEYISVSPSFFDGLVANGIMPSPVRLGRRNIWDRAQLDLAFNRLQPHSADPALDGDGINPWDEPV